MTSEQRRQESEDYWFNSTEARNVLEDFVPSREKEETILTDEGQEPAPVQLDAQTRAEDIVRNEAQPERIQLETLPEDFDVDAAWSSIENKDADDEFAKLGLERPRGESIVPEEERGIVAEGIAGGARGIDQTQAMGFGLLGLMGEALQVEGLSDLGVEGYKRNMEEAAKNQASVQDPFEEIGGVGDAALYATGVLSEQLPQLLVSLLGGGVGGYTAKTIAKKVVANEIGKRVAAGMAKEEAEKVVSKLVAQRALQGFDVPMIRGGVPLMRDGVERTVSGVGQEALQQATKAGALGGAYVANVGQIAGGSFGEIEQETGERDPVNALGFALLGGALETAGEALVAAPIANKLIGGRTIPKLSEVEAKRTVVGSLVAGTGRLAGTSAAEGGTEYSQTFLEQAAVASADPNRTLAEVAGTPEAERERQLAATAGVVAGGGLGAVSQAASYLIPETSRRVNEVLQKRQQQQGQQGQGQEQEQQQDAPADEEWSEPVTIASRNEDYNGLEYRQNKAGQVWAFNVPEVSRFGAFAIPTKYGQGVLLNPAFEGASDIRSEVKAKLAEMADPEAFKAPPVTPPKKVEENLEDADLVEGDEVASNAEEIAAAAERRRLRDQEVLARDLESAAATLARPQEDAKGFVESLKEGDQVSVLTEDGEGNAFAIPMTFVRLNQNGQAQLRSEPDEDNKVATRLYDADEFNRITTRPADQVAPAATTTGTGIKVSPLTAPIRPAAEGEQLSEAERAQNLLYFKDVEGSKIDDNLWINSARELGVEITPETTGAVAEQEIRSRFGVERTTTKQDDPASQVLMDALGPNPTRQKLESMTGTRWTGKGSKFTWMLPDKLGGKGIPVTTRLFNRKAPAEALPIPQRSTTSGFKPEEQGGTAPAAPDIQTKGPDLIAKSSAEFVGVRRGENNELVTARPTRGQDNATYLQEVDTAADTTIRQMNYLGQPVLVTPETAQSLAEANQFWTEHEQRQKAGTAKADRQPVRFYTQERSDKDGNRNTFITGVTYEGRTYRVGKTPQEFSVDRALTQRGAKSRRRGLGIYDPIRIASPSRIARSEAGMAAAKTEAGDGPLAEALRGVQGRAAMAELNEAENAVYGFFDAKITNPILNIQDPAVTTEVRDTALEAARAKVAAAFLKVKQANPSETTKVLPGRQRTIGEKVAERLTAYQEAKRAKAIQALRDKFKGIREKTASAKAGARGTGTAKALKMSPQGAMNLITRARRDQKTGIAESKRMTRDEAMTALQELVDFGALDQEKKDAQIKRILDKADKFTEIERDEMQQSIISELAKEDKAAAAKQGRKYSRSEAQVAQERRLVLSTINLLDDPAIRTLSPYRIGNSALSAAKRTATRKGMTRDEISLDDENQGAGDEVALKVSQPDDKGQITQGKLAEKGKPVGVENKLGGIALFSNDYEESLNRFDSLTEEDRQLLNRLSDTEIERGDLRGRQIKGITENERLRAARVVAFLQDKISYEQLYQNRSRRSGEAEYIRRAAQRRAASRRSGQPVAGTQGVPDSGQSAGNLAGVAESRAARTPDPAPTGRAERVVGSPADPAGTVQESTAGQTGGRGVQPTPRRTRAVAAAAQRDFAGAILGLNEAETAALPQGTVDRVYQSYLATLDGVLAEQGNNPLTASAAPAADTVTADGKKMFERFAAARLNPDQQRAAIIRSNMAQAYRAGLFDEDPVVSAINKIANDKTQPMNLRLMAKEFAKNAKRGVRFDRVVLDIGRFTKPGNKQTTWAGLFSLTPEGAPVVSVNLDNLHDKNSVPLTFLHELQHVVIRDKVRRSIPLTRAEEQALARLEDLRGQAVIAAARQQGIEVGATPNINALAEQLYALTDPNSTQSGAAVDNRRLAGLVNLEEFVIEMIGNPDMVRLLSELGFGEARTDGKRFSLTGALRNAWNAVVELITGVKVDPTSPLAMAFKDSWTVNFGTARNPNITEIKASKRLADRQQAQTRQQYVEGEIEARDMAGTTRDRSRIMQEITGPADAETNAMRASMLDAARSMTEDQWVAAARAQGFNFVDPGAVYRQARAEAIQAAPEQATGDTVKVAESRAVRSQSVVIPDERLPDLIAPREFHKLVSYTDDEGHTRLDSAALLESMKQRESNVDGRVYGKRYAVRIMDEVLEFGTFPSLKKYFDSGGFRDGLVVEVYKNGNNQIVADFNREDTNPSIRNYFNRQSPQVAESRAVGRVTPQQDADYLAAVERGDMEAAQRMVDEAARGAGYTPNKLYHGSAFEFDQFLKEKLGSITMVPSADEGFFFTTRRRTSEWFRDLAQERSWFQRHDAKDKELAVKRAEQNIQWNREQLEKERARERPSEDLIKLYENGVEAEKANLAQAQKAFDAAPKVKPTIYEAYLSLKNPLVHDYKGKVKREKSYKELLTKAKEEGRDGVILRNTYDSGERDKIDAFFKGRLKEPEDIYVVFEPNQIKRGDPITRDAQGNVIPLSQRFNEALPDIRFSRAVRRPFASDTATTYNGKTYTRPGLIFGENANLDPRATKLVTDLKLAKRGAEQYANLRSEELKRLIRKVYKDQPVPTDLINDALGNLDNPLTDQQFDEIKRLELTDPEAAVAKRIAYLGENRARFRTERQAPALLALPEELAEFLRKIGDGTPDSPGDLRKLQQQALDLGIPKGDMATAFSENLGIYLTRSYNAFIDQENWEETLRREDRELREHSRMGQFRNMIRTTLIGQRADDLQTKAQEEGRTLSRAEAERRAKEGTTTEEVDQMLESYIAYTKEEPSSESFSGLRLPGRQNIKSLEQRKLLSDALREFYGQVENPAINFVTSYAKLSSLIANHKFQADLKNLGLKEGWLWDQEKNVGQRPPSGYERIAADNDKSLQVLAGLYARSDLVRGLRETFPPNSMEAAQWWLHPFMKLTGLSMGMKTVGSIASQIRNYWSSYAPVIAGGNFTIADLFRPEWRKNWKEAHGVSIANVFRNYRGDRDAITKRIKRLYELGVMGESLTVGLLNDLTRLGKDASINDEQFFNNFEKILKKPGRRVWNATKQVWEKAEQIYGMTDDIFKIFTYLSEFDKYKKIYPNMSDAELEQKAANIARDIHWTYSKAPAVVNELKKFPFIAPFITFTTETIRITANLGKLAINERKEGQRLREQGLRENNAELVRQGDEFLKISNKRFRGMAAVAVGPWALGAMAMTAAGFSGDDEEDLRQFLPDWQKNSQLIIIGKNGSEVNYVDVSYLDPFEIWKKPMTAFMRGLGRAENVEEFFTEAVVGAAIEAGRPFTSEQILSGAIMDVMRNRDANGRQVYNPQDTGTAIASAVGSKLASAFAPGTLDTGERIVKAFGGQISETGRDYNLANEVFGVPFGSRVSAVDAEQALGFKASQFLRARRDARSIFNRDYLSRGSRSESDVVSAYQRSNAGLRDVTERLRREYIAALNLGVSPAKARSVLRASGLDRESARMISTGIYRRLTPSEEQDRMAAPERKRAARQAIAETPQREVLFP